MDVTPTNRDTQCELLERLRVEHSALKRRLIELDGYHSLTHEEELERAQLKKLKLQKKDQMQELNALIGEA